MSPGRTCQQELTVLAVQLLAYVSFYILGAKVRSRALLFLYKLFFQLVYHVFYRNLVRPALFRTRCAKKRKAEVYSSRGSALPANSPLSNCYPLSRSL
jgi:hypothetical protein